MEIASLAKVATHMSQARTNESTELAVLKKAIDIQAEGALALLKALPQPASGNAPAGSLPENLGQNINVVV